MACPYARVVNESDSREVHQQSRAAIQNLDDDRLEFTSTAQALASLVESEDTPAPYNIAVAGAWGAGKSSVLNLTKSMLEARLENNSRSKFVFCEFDAWQHDDAKDIKADLYQTMLRVTASSRRFYSKIIHPIPRTALGKPSLPQSILMALLRQLRVWIILGAGTMILSLIPALLLFWRGQEGLLELLLGIVSFGLITGQTIVQDPPQFSLKWLAYLAPLPIPSLIATIFRRVHPLHYLTSKQPVVPSHRIQSLRNQLHVNFQQMPWNRRVIVIIENLDRCSASSVLGILEALTQVLDSPRVITISAIDLDAITTTLQRESNLSKHEIQSILEKTFDLTYGVPHTNPRDLPKAFELQEESEDYEEVGVNEERQIKSFTEFAWIAFLFYFAPTVWAWRFDGLYSELSLLSRSKKLVILPMFAFAPIVLPYLIVREFIEIDPHGHYPLERRDQRAKFQELPMLLAWSLGILLVSILATLAITESLPLRSISDKVVMGYYVFLVVQLASITYGFKLMLRIDDSKLRAYRNALETGENYDPLPPRLSGTEATRVEDAVRWSKNINSNERTLEEQEAILAKIFLTPRQYKQWSNRLKLTLAIRQDHGVLDSEQDLDYWCKWTLLQQLHPDFLEKAARQLYGPEGARTLQEELGSWPESHRNLWSGQRGVESKLQELLRV